MTTAPAPKAVRATRPRKQVRPHVATGIDADAALADEIEREIQHSALAQLIIRRARAEAEKAKDALAVANPFEPNTILMLQNEIARHDQIAAWIAQVRQEGLAALQALEEQYGLEYGDDAASADA